MVKLESKNYFYLLIISALTFVIVLLIIFFPVRFLWKDNQKLFRETKEKKTELAYLEDKEKKLEKLEDKKEELEIQKDKALSALPEEKDQARILTQIEYIAASSGASVKDNQDQSSLSSGSSDGDESISKTPSGITEVPFQIGFEGSYSALKTFLEKVETAIRILNVDSISVRNKEDSGLLDITIKAKTFFKTLGGQQ